MRTRAAAVTFALVVLAGAAGAVPLAAQQGLERIDGLVRSGRTEEARVALLSWWEAEWESASREDAQQALWLRARLTVDPREAELDFRRLAIEYPGGSYSDLALLRLAQAAHAFGDQAAAARHAAELARDYPESVAAREAVRWLRAAGAPLTRVRAEAMTDRPADQRRGEIVHTAPPRREVGPTADASGGPYGVQVGAFASAARARSLRDRLTELGVPARVVRLPRTQLLHVRAGRFDSEEEARELLADVERLGFGGSVVSDADREEPVGG